MEAWRKYFKSSGADLWTICERALTLAHIEDPGNFPLRRDELAQKLFAPEKLVSQASEKDAPPSTTKVENTKGLCGQNLRKEDDLIDTYDEAEVLTEEMEEEILLKRSVLSIKDILEKSCQSEKMILDSLQRLQLMQLSVDVLHDTEIGKTVNNLRKNPSKRVTVIAKQLVRNWKDLVNELLKSAQDVAAAATSEAPASASPNYIDKGHGLPSPPMDEGVLLTTHTGCMEISQLFDFMYCDKSAGSDGPNCFEDDCLQSSLIDHKKPSDFLHNISESQSVIKLSRSQENCAGKDNSNWKDSERHTEKELKTNLNGYLEKVVHLSKYNCDATDRRMITSSNERSPTGSIVRSVESRNQLIHTLKSGCTLPQRRDDVDYDEKIEATKRKLQEIYQQADQAKKQRTIRIMDLQDLPKGGSNHTRPDQGHSKARHQHRSLVAGPK